MTSSNIPTLVTLLVFKIETRDFHSWGTGMFLILFHENWKWHPMTSSNIQTPCYFVVFADRNTRLLFLRSWHFTDLISWNRKWRHMTSSNVQTPVTFLFLQIETWDFHFWDPVMFLIRFNETGSDVIKYSNPCNFAIFEDRNTRLLFLRSWHVFDLNFLQLEGTSYDVIEIFQTHVTLLVFADRNMRLLFLWGPGMLSDFNFMKLLKWGHMTSSKYSKSLLLCCFCR